MVKVDERKKRCLTNQMFIYHNHLLVAAGRAWKLRRPHQLDKKKQHIPVRKKRADTDLEFFSLFFSCNYHKLIPWVASSLSPPLKHAPKIWTRKLSSPFIFAVCLYLIKWQYTHTAGPHYINLLKPAHGLLIVWWFLTSPAGGISHYFTNTQDTRHTQPTVKESTDLGLP